MATDLIEKNELSALAPMRTGNGFVDDDGYLNASASKTRALENEEVLAVRRRFPDPKDCTELDGTMQALDAYIETLDKSRLTARGAGEKNRVNAQVKAAGVRKSELVRISNILGCSVTKMQAQAEAERKELQGIKELVQTTQAAKSTKTMDYVIYGAVGLAVVGVLAYVLIKK